MGAASSLLHRFLMTKKRVKLGLAALGILFALILALVGLLFAPTMASAEKNSGATNGYVAQPGSGNSFGSNYSEHASGEGSDKGSDADEQLASNADTCAGGFLSCTDPAASWDTDTFGGGSFPGSSSHSVGEDQQGENEQNQGGNPPSGFPPSFFAGGPGGGGNGPSFSNAPDFNAPENENSPNESAETDEITDPGSNQGGPDPDSRRIPFDDDPENPLAPPGDGSKPDTGPPPSGNPPDENPLPENPPLSIARTTQVPEPLTVSLFAVGLAGSVVLRRPAKNKPVDASA